MTTTSVPTAGRADVLRRIADHLLSQAVDHPLRVGVDGICGVGKTTFACELAAVLRSRGRPVIELDSDGFHHLRARRYRQGRQSARGYYEDAYDFGSLAAQVLEPLGPGGSGRYAMRVHDLHTDATIADATAVAPADAVMIFAATFLQRPELYGRWDEVIYLHAEEEAARERGVARDTAVLGGEAAARAAYASRYLAACRLYLAECDPRSRASIVIEHTDPATPVIERGI